MIYIIQICLPTSRKTTTQLMLTFLWVPLQSNKHSKRCCRMNSQPLWMQCQICSKIKACTNQIKMINHNHKCIKKIWWTYHKEGCMLSLNNCKTLFRLDMTIFIIQEQTKELFVSSSISLFLYLIDWSRLEYNNL